MSISKFAARGVTVSADTHYLIADATRRPQSRGRPSSYRRASSGVVIDPKGIQLAERGV
jgi:hypothetical protein